MAKNKNQMIAEIKDKIGKSVYTFPIGTMIEMDYYDDYLTTCLMHLKVKKNVLHLITKTIEHGVETDKLSDFHSDYVKMVYDIVMA